MQRISKNNKTSKITVIRFLASYLVTSQIETEVVEKQECFSILLGYSSPWKRKNHKKINSEH